MLRKGKTSQGMAEGRALHLSPWQELQVTAEIKSGLDPGCATPHRDGDGGEWQSSDYRQEVPCLAG